MGTRSASDPPRHSLDPFCGTATSGEVALKLGRHFVGIELYENNAQIAEDRYRQAHFLRSEFEAKNPIKASTPSFDQALNDTMPDEVDYSLDFDPKVPWDGKQHLEAVCLSNLAGFWL
jgi:hypothetical protein